jgi:hypothetical protein
MERLVIGYQRPEEPPVSLREELHIKVPDAASILYRTQLSALARGTRLATMAPEMNPGEPNL